MAANSGGSGREPLTRPCKKCSSREAALNQRSDTVCRECFAYFVGTKCARQMGVLGRQTVPAPGQETRRYLMGLSLGTSSSVMLHLLDNYVETGLAKNRRTPFDLRVIYVDPSMSAEDDTDTSLAIADYQRRYPRFAVERVSLTEAIGLPAIEWSALPPLELGATKLDQLQGLFRQLPSTTSKADVARLFTRQVLLSKARETSCQAVLLGHSTTALAEMTLAETAKGKGFSLPWLVTNGTLPMPYQSSSGSSVKNVAPSASSQQSLKLYYPLRELFRGELRTYATLTSPPLTGLIPVDRPKTGTVVSYKDLSIDEVVSRYFQDVEVNYPSIVANVVRTTAKLDRVDAEDVCGLCGSPLDQQGDARWKGELGDDRGGSGDEHLTTKRICYGCERSVHN